MLCQILTQLTKGLNIQDFSLFTSFCYLMSDISFNEILNIINQIIKENSNTIKKPEFILLLY